MYKSDYSQYNVCIGGYYSTVEILSQIQEGVCWLWEKELYIHYGGSTETPQSQKQMLGERLFPLIQKLYLDLAAKLTSMMLEKENIF